MADAKSERLPRRDAAGRITHLPDLIGTALAGVVVGILVLGAFDLAFALSRLGTFGQANGWLGVILPAWLFVEEFRAWGPGAGRIAAAALATAVGLAAGLVCAALADALPALGSGGVGAAVFAVSYALVWFVGVRWLADRTG